MNKDERPVQTSSGRPISQSTEIGSNGRQKETATSKADKV